MHDVRVFRPLLRSNVAQTIERIQVGTHLSLVLSDVSFIPPLAIPSGREMAAEGNVCDENDNRKETAHFGRTREGGSPPSLVSAFKWRLVGAGTRAGLHTVPTALCLPQYNSADLPLAGYVSFFLS